MIVQVQLKFRPGRLSSRTFSPVLKLSTARDCTEPVLSTAMTTRWRMRMVIIRRHMSTEYFRSVAIHSVTKTIIVPSSAMRLKQEQTQCFVNEHKKMPFIIYRNESLVTSMTHLGGNLGWKSLQQQSCVPASACLDLSVISTAR